MIKNIESAWPQVPMKKSLRRPALSTSGNEMHADKAYTVARTEPRMSESLRPRPRYSSKIGVEKSVSEASVRIHSSRTCANVQMTALHPPT